MSILIPFWLIGVFGIFAYLFLIYVVSVYCEMGAVKQPWAGLASVLWPLTFVLLILVVVAAVFIRPFTS